MKIARLKGYQILDSRGNPTLEVEVMLQEGSRASFKVPSGASTGIHEANELRDNDPEKYNGKSVENAVEKVRFLEEKLTGTDFDQEELDNELKKLDGTKTKKKLGANTILGTSIAFAKASAKYYHLPLYDYLNKMAFNKRYNTFGIKPKYTYIFSNIINGGLHTGNDLKIQEFMIVPNLENTHENIRAISEAYHVLKTIIEKKYGKPQTGVGDEGGFSPSISSPKEALELLNEAIAAIGCEGKIGIAIDAAASDFYNKKSKKYEVEKDKKLDYKELAEYYDELIKNYPIISIEDPFSEDDFHGHEYFRKRLKKTQISNFINNSNKPIIVGDDLLVTNPERIKEVQKKNLCNSLLLKINQIGTLTEALEAYTLAKNKGWPVIISHRSGETEDSFITDLAVALNTSMKIGAPARGERTAKYNRLLKIYN